MLGASKAAIVLSKVRSVGCIGVCRSKGMVIKSKAGWEKKKRAHLVDWLAGSMVRVVNDQIQTGRGPGGMPTPRAFPAEANGVAAGSASNGAKSSLSLKLTGDASLKSPKLVEAGL